MPIQVKAPDGVAVTLSVSGSERATAHCFGSCALRLFPGSYRLYAEDGRSKRTFEHSLQLTGSGTIDVKFGDPAARGGGIALTVVGGVAAAVGLGLFFDGLEHRVLCDADCKRGNVEMTAGLLVGLAGSVALPIGLVLASSERDRAVFDEEPPSERSEAARIQLGVARLPQGGVGLAGSFRF